MQVFKNAPLVGRLGSEVQYSVIFNFFFYLESPAGTATMSLYSVQWMFISRFPDATFGKNSIPMLKVPVFV